MAVAAPQNYEQCDYSGAQEVWGLEQYVCRVLLHRARLMPFCSEGPLVQDLGSVQTKAGRCIAFPNIYQHCVALIRDYIARYASPVVLATLLC